MPTIESCAHGKNPFLESVSKVTKSKPSRGSRADVSPHQLINQDSGRTDYFTPVEIINAARQVMGGIDLDPASCAEANRIVNAVKFYTAKNNGLTQPWAGRVWMNHPFSRSGNKAWVNKLVQDYESGRVTEACCITYASTSESWFQPLLRRPQCFLARRLHYVLPSGTTLRATTKGSVITYFGQNVEAFAAAFRNMGVIKIAFPPRA